MISLPSSSLSRNQHGHIRLIISVDLSALPGLQLRGRFARPGAKLRIEDLPRPAIALEHAGRLADPAARTAAERRRSFADLWILWHFDFEAEIWIEVMRTTTRDSSFLIDFGAAAARLIDSYGLRQPAAEARPLAARAISSIAAVLAEAAGDVQCYLLAEIESFLAEEIVRRIERQTGRMIELAGARFANEGPAIEG
jgi:hypothetical protein